VTPGRAVLDSAVPLHALGGASPWREAAAHVLELGADGSIELLASVEMIPEVAYHRLRRGVARERAIGEAENLAELVTLLPLDARVLRQALRLMRAHAGVRGRDAVHAATALAAGVGVLISPDSDFDAIPGLTRLDPAALAAA
jgi:predicted nucleic acid-binding protein